MREFAITSAPEKIPDAAFAPALNSTITFAQERPARPFPSVASNVDDFAGRVFAPNATRFVPVAFYEPVPSIALDVPRRLDVGEPQVPDAAPSETSPSLASAPALWCRSARRIAKTSELAHGRLRTQFRARSGLDASRAAAVRWQVGGAETANLLADRFDNGYNAGANFDVRPARAASTSTFRAATNT